MTRLFLQMWFGRNAASARWCYFWVCSVNRAALFIPFPFLVCLQLDAAIRNKSPVQCKSNGPKGQGQPSSPKLPRQPHRSLKPWQDKGQNGCCQNREGGILKSQELPHGEHPRLKGGLAAPSNSLVGRWEAASPECVAVFCLKAFPPLAR